MYEKILKKYYDRILSYCCMKLQDKHAAEDCTQEVFLLLYTKLEKLNLSHNIQGWLYAASDRIILAYQRKHPNMLSLDMVPEQSAEPDFLLEEMESALDFLNTSERQLMEVYYSGADRKKIAGHLGLTTNALYIRVLRIREKLKMYMDKMHN